MPWLDTPSRLRLVRGSGMTSASFLDAGNRGRHVIEFKELGKEDKPVLDRFFRARYYENSHLNFTNLFMWRTPYHIRWAVEGDVLYMVNEWEGKLSARQPFGPEEKWREGVEKFLAYFRAQGQTLSFMGLEKDFAQFLASYESASFAVTDDRDNADYVYLAEKLITLAGRKLHSKKNHLNAFHKLYPQAEYLPITRELIPACRKELESWYQLRAAELDADPFIGYERAAIHEIFDNYEDFALKGGVIRIDGRVVAFTFGEQLNRDTAVIHVEKADPNVRGAYPAINQGFVSHAWSDRTYINREEDMGLPGLRKAKESYKPVKMIEKFNAVYKGEK